jgi:hypothetical protein
MSTMRSSVRLAVAAVLAISPVGCSAISQPRQHC